MPNVIEMSDIHKFYKMGSERLEVLKGVSLTVEKGGFVAILGPSGSGKTTLMNIIGCMDDFQQGSYMLSGKRINGMSDSQLTKVRNSRIGFIFQKYHLVSRYTVLQNVMLPLLIRGCSSKMAAAAAKEKLDMLGMSERINHRPNELSGGQQQRTAIARALVGNPDLLLADEPTGALDRATGQDVLKLFEELNRLGHTIVMITHDHSVAEHAQRIINIVDGNTA